MNEDFYIKNSFIDWQLISAKLKGELTGDEEITFEKWLQEDESHQRYFEDVRRAWDTEEFTPETDIQALIKEFDLFTGTPKSRRYNLARLMKYAAAILIILGFSGVIAYYISSESREKYPEQALLADPILPGSNKAQIILSDGTVFLLENISDTIISRGNENIHIDMTQGNIRYDQNPEEESHEEIFNTIVIPRGGQFYLTLSDGTNVWLNSDTRFRFPVNFRDKNRNVELNGEAFFEVTKDEEKPFHVKTPQAVIHVLGTSFNVYAYETDKIHYTTLASGKVQISDGEEEVILLPGDQAVIAENEKIQIAAVNVDSYCSWYKGYLKFEEESLENIMKRMSRWYDVEIVFNASDLRERHFTGDLKRYANLENILRLIEKTTDVRFNIQNKTVYVDKI